MANTELRDDAPPETDRRTKRAYLRAERDAIKAASKANRKAARRKSAGQDGFTTAPAPLGDQIPAPAPMIASVSRFGIPEDI